MKFLSRLLDRNYSNINGRNLESLIKKGNIVIIDVRPSQNYRSGHIPGAINIPLENLQGKLNTLNEYRNLGIVVYCKSGIRSAQASTILSNNGFNYVYNLSGGISSYKGKLVK